MTAKKTSLSSKYKRKAKLEELIKKYKEELSQVSQEIKQLEAVEIQKIIESSDISIDELKVLLQK